MEVIVNPKSLEGVHQGVNVIQLETAVGAAMKVNWKIDLLLPSNQHEFYVLYRNEIDHGYKIY